MASYVSKVTLETCNSYSDSGKWTIAQYIISVVENLRKALLFIRLFPLLQVKVRIT